MAAISLQMVYIEVFDWNEVQSNGLITQYWG